MSYIGDRLCELALYEAQKENEELKLELIARFGELQTLLEENDELMAHVDSIEALSVWSWMSAALEDEAVCAEMKRDIEEAFNRVALTPAQSLRHIESRIADRQCKQLLAAVAEETIDKHARDIATEFFYHWYNVEGSNTAQGFDDWWEINRERFMPRKYKEQSDETNP